MRKLLQCTRDHAINFGAGEQARLLTVVLGSVAAQELADSIAEGSAAAPLGPQGPHQSFNFVDLSGGREKNVWFEQ